ncbi:hypothetical protein BHE74_00022479 [Ensete ventricosum]|nr:hypothetical protein BHE74_00022479 [Ensete ventricosum]
MPLRYSPQTGTYNQQEQHRAIGLESEAIMAYKELEGFRRGLLRSRKTSYQYRYLVALGHFKVKYIGISIKEDPFT